MNKTTVTAIPRLNAADLEKFDATSLTALQKAVCDVGFITVYNTALSAADVEKTIAAYRQFFEMPKSEKESVNMARTGASRGWGAPMSEQVDPNANPDYKEVFDSGFVPAADHPLAHLPVYAPNLWPDTPEGFREQIEGYYRRALEVAMIVLRAISKAILDAPDYFDDKFDVPMALLRGNYYPERPDWAGEQDFGIAEHTDYGCVTLLAMDGTPGLEVQMPDGSWSAVTAQPGEFVINFGEMLQMWTNGAVKATLHRVVGSKDTRISVPLFFNPNYSTNVAPLGSDQTIVAGDHLTKRYQETYVHLKG